MESWAYYKALKFIEAYWHECWYIMNSMNFTLETSNYIKLPVIFIGKKAFYFAFEIDRLDTISVNVSFEKYCFVLIIIIRPVSNWNHSWIIMLGCFVDLRLFTEFSLTLNSHLIVLFGSPHNVIRPAIDLFLFIFIKYSGSVGEKALTIKEANLHIGKVNENVYSCIKRHFDKELKWLYNIWYLKLEFFYSFQIYHSMTIQYHNFMVWSSLMIYLKLGRLFASLSQHLFINFTKAYGVFLGIGGLISLFST